MSALSYLYLTRLKNRLLQMVRKPATLIFMLFIVAMLGVTIFSGFMMDQDGDVLYMPLSYLQAGLVLIYSFVFLSMAAKGLDAGATIFTMSDVDLVFTAPMHPRKVLFYGLVQQLGSSLLLGLFILFQYAWLHQLFGISYPFLLIILLGYAAAAFCGQLAAMVMYSLTANSEKAHKMTKAVFYAVPALFALRLFFGVLLTGLDAPLISAAEIVTGSAVRFFPVGGWLGMAVGGAIAGDMVSALVGLTLTAAAVAGVVIVMVKADLDFYEDVLQTAEAGLSALTAAKEGRVADSSPKKVKLGRTGLGAGWGASAFYHKHMLENRRSGGLLLSPQQLIFAAITIGLAFFMKEVSIIAVFVFGVYMQIFSVALGRYNRELLKPFVYLVPEPAYKKMLHCLREALPTTVLESVIIMVPVGLIMGATPVVTAGFVLARMASAAVILAANLLMGRLFSGVESKALSLMVYFMAVALMFAPPAAAAVGVWMLLPGLGDAAVALGFCAAAIPEATLVGWLCRDALEYAELNFG